MLTRSFCLVLSGLLVIACSEHPTGATAPVATPSAATSVAPTYHILDKSMNEAISKLNVAVLLDHKLSEAQVRELALKLKDSLGSYEKNYLTFYLPGMKVGRGAWATAQFTPTEETRILGATQAEEDSSKSKLRGDGRLIGKWYEEQRSTSGLAFYEKAGRCYLTRVYKGGTPVVTRYMRTGNTFRPVEESGLGEYFVLQAGDTLNFVNNKGDTFGQALPLR